MLEGLDLEIYARIAHQDVMKLSVLDRFRTSSRVIYDPPLHV